MKIDMAMHLHNTNGLVDRQQQLDQTIQMNWYMQLKKGSRETSETIKKRSLRFLQKDHSSVIQRQSHNMLSAFQ